MFIAIKNPDAWVRVLIRKELQIPTTATQEKKSKSNENHIQSVWEWENQEINEDEYGNSIRTNKNKLDLSGNTEVD